MSPTAFRYKNYRFLFFLVFSFLGVMPLQADIKVIPEREYFSIVYGLLSGAKDSIDMEMYLVHSNSIQVKRLLDGLVEAKGRGVKVNVLLEEGEEKNKLTAEYLKNKGLSVSFDGPESKLHAKTILIDSKKLVIGSSNWTEKAFNENNESNVLVDMEEDKDRIQILQTDYVGKLVNAIENAKNEIDIIIYSFQFEYNEESKNYEIMKAILRARDRGCRIKIILDSWSEGESGNEAAYQVLKQAGMEVYYDLDSIATHNKLVVIDNEIVFLGSANWTEAGLTQNRETSILLRDPSTSRIYKSYIDKLIDSLPEKEETNVLFPVSFLERGGLFQRLYCRGMVQGLKLYCWFMWEAFSKKTFSFKIDYKGWYEAIYGESALPWNNSKNTRIYNIVWRLEKEKAVKREGNIITLIDLADIGENNEGLFIPVEFWTWGWVRRLSGSEIYFYLLSLSEFKKSPYKPVWIDSQKNLARKYGIRYRSISEHLKKLMYYNLIEIQHDIPDPDEPFDKRKANRYFINPLWNEDELSLKWRRLAEREGMGLFLKARCLAAKINEPYDPKAVASLLTLIKIYGEEAVTDTVDKVTALSFANGKWELRYIIGILQKDYKPIVANAAINFS